MGNWTGQDSVRDRQEGGGKAAAHSMAAAHGWRRGTAQKGCPKTTFAVFTVLRSDQGLLCRCAHSPAAERRRTASQGLPTAVICLL